MTLTALEKLEQQRAALENDVITIELTVALHQTTPLVEAQVDKLAKDVDEALLLSRDINKAVYLCKPPDLTVHNQVYSNLYGKLITLHGQLATIRAKLPRSTPTGPTGGPAPTPQDIRLPRLELPQFNGDQLQWPSFRDLFVAAVENKTTLSKVEKLTYLKASLTGEAARQVQAYSLTDVNYDLAWKSLTDRYENEREQLFAVLKKFFTQQQASPNTSSIRTLIDNSKGFIRTFTMLKGTLDQTVTYIIFTKMDPSTKELWFQQQKASSIPTITELFHFLEQRALSLAAGGTTTSRAKGNQHAQIQGHHVQQQQFSCSMSCPDSHRLFKCPHFAKLTVQQRRDHVKSKHLCYNCLGGHTSRPCKSTHVCKLCRENHHTMLHHSKFDNNVNAKKNQDLAQQQPPPDDQAPGSSRPCVHGLQSGTVPPALLATALVRINGKHGSVICRAFLDNGSSNSFISIDCCRRLNLKTIPVDANITGLGSSYVAKIDAMTDFVMTPYFSDTPKFSVDAFVIKKVTADLPSTTVTEQDWSYLKNLKLADPHFTKPDNIDILIGSDIFWQLLVSGIKKGDPMQPVAVNTELGWLVAGRVTERKSQRINCYMTNVELNNQLEKFWKIEDIEPTTSFTLDEQQCENIFQATTTRDPTSGRFTTPIPWKTPRPVLGDSRRRAVKRLQQMERRFSLQETRDPTCTHRNEYIQFMRQYKELGHMSPVPQAEVAHPPNSTYYIPHHFVLKDDSTTTKFRVVFDASAKTTTGVSLNDCMLVGPTIQSSLFDILLRFRIHKIAFTADITKMYRQVEIPKADQDLHRILWREDSSQEIQEFRLHTVTYGTASAPYLATRCLHALADQEENKYPEAAAALRKDFYVDDLLSGSKDVNSAKQKIKQLTQVCASAQFPLRKWACSNQDVLNSIPVEYRETKELIPIQDPTIKTLGVHWDPLSDHYLFKITLPEDQSGYTKRKILSEIAQVFDPVGWLAPATITAKIIMQQLWKVDLDWDTPLDDEIQQQWISYKHELKQLEELRIPRLVISSQQTKISLVGFCDASEKAYAALVYIYEEDEGVVTNSSLLTTKTRVAPLKTITLPRLELQAAVLLSELLQSVQEALPLKFHSIRAYSDSTITLAWIESDHNRWKSYVKNRILIIKNNIPTATWSHVPGDSNPADCASRGIPPNKLIGYELYWKGNTTLKQRLFPPNVDLTPVLCEERPQLRVHAAKQESEFISRFSSYHTLRRVTAHILRWRQNATARRTGEVKLSGPFTVTELNNARAIIVKLVQSLFFAAELQFLKNKAALPISNKLILLNPFIDADGVLRVGGRLKNSQLPFNHKHPMLLPKECHLTKLIIEDIHVRNLHAGPQMILATLNQNYWVLRARDAVRMQLKRCVTCRRHRGELINQQMGNLPAPRVTPSKPFQRTGVDYAGPFTLKNVGRSKITYKAYLVVFVCFSTRAVHLDIVSTLSSDGFIQVLNRFVSRRGCPSDIFSDCGTNFIGANRILNRQIANVQDEAVFQSIKDPATKLGIVWHFNPPSAPHFGGLWEAGVKSVKYHLQRVLGPHTLTYEELCTIVIQIEGILNSRPLTPFSNDPNDLEVLTPAHFLIGEPINAIPEPNLMDEKIARLDRFQLIQQRQQMFWRRWSREFITRMQQRPKWQQVREQLQLNDIVIIKEEALPPGKWKLGRVVELHPGNDGVVRVVTLKTQNGIVKRPLCKLARLPVLNDSNSPEVGLQ